MSSFPQHGARWFVFSSLVGLPWFVGVIIALVGAFPDLYALPETMRGIWNNLYKKSHTMIWWKYVLFPIAEHIGFDKISHKSTGGWYWWAYVLEVILDIGVVFFIVLYWHVVYVGAIVFFGIIIVYSLLVLIIVGRKHDSD